MRMKKYEMKYMFDWGSGTCLWSVNDATIHEFDYAVSIEQMPVSNDLRKFLYELISRHDEALNWENPAGDLLWSDVEQDIYIRDAQTGYKRLCEELENTEFQIHLAQLI